MSWNDLPHRMSEDGPEEQLLWFSVCRDCSWEEEEAHEDQGDCMTAVCPCCGGENIEDVQEWI